MSITFPHGDFGPASLDRLEAIGSPGREAAIAFSLLSNF
jgi:hypothetical protein